MKDTFLLVLFTALLTLMDSFAEAQQTKVPRIGYLGLSEPSSPLFDSFRQGLRELGYVEGQNIILDERIGEEAQLPGLAADLVRLKKDVIVAQSPAIRAAMSATKTIPIVAAFPGDPVLNGMVTSLDRPGGNLTGVGALSPELGGKWLELIRQTIPNAKRVAVFWYRSAEDSFPMAKTVESAARSLGVDLRWEEVGPKMLFWLYRRLRSAVLRQVDAFIVLPGFGGMSLLEDIADFGLRNRIPGIFGRSDLNIEQMGGLMAYGVNRFEQSRRAAYFVDKILKGAMPAELPVELPKKFELVVNLKAAKEMNLAIPVRVLAWADNVIK